jgi:hemerythrin-like domain-containing protein
MSDQSQVNIGENFILQHKIYTRGLKVSLENVNKFLEEGGLTSKNSDGFLKYLESLSSLLEGHHLVENEKVFPYFQDKLPGVPYERLMSEHSEIKAALARINSAIADLKSGKDEIISLKSIKSSLDTIDGLWHTHIQIEESQLYTKIVTLKISTEETNMKMQEFTQFFQEHTSGPPYLNMPFVLYNLSPEDRAIFAKNFPETVLKQLVPVDWKDKWAPMKPFLLK